MFRRPTPKPWKSNPRNRFGSAKNQHRNPLSTNQREKSSSRLSSEDSSHSTPKIVVSTSETSIPSVTESNLHSQHCSEQPFLLNTPTNQSESTSNEKNMPESVPSIDKNSKIEASSDHDTASSLDPQFLTEEPSHLTSSPSTEQLEQSTNEGYSKRYFASIDVNSKSHSQDIEGNSYSVSTTEEIPRREMVHVFQYYKRQPANDILYLNISNPSVDAVRLYQKLLHMASQLINKTHFRFS